MIIIILFAFWTNFATAIAESPEKKPTIIFKERELKRNIKDGQTDCVFVTV